MITKDQFNLATEFCSRFGMPAPKMETVDVENERQQVEELQPQEDESTYHNWEDDVIEYDQQEEY